MDRRLFLLSAPLALAGCAAEPVWAPDELIERARYRHNGPARLTLMTMRNVGSGSGAHSSLMINAHERILWDPAGSFKHPSIPERNDVIFGVTPEVEQYYLTYHARESYYMVIQELDVAPEIASRAYHLALKYGAVAKAHCAVSTSEILQQLPGFEHITTTYYPVKLEEQFATLPNVRTRTYREYDSDDKSVAAAEIDAQIRARHP